jgi:hypothetical protein
MTEYGNIKVGFCVSYDWEFLKISVPRVYEYADIICLGIDKNRYSWSGNPYKFDEKAFRDFLTSIDKQNKIVLLEGNYSSPTLNSRENCNLQRKEIAERMGSNGWHIQIDSDEYFLDFKGFADYLKGLNPSPKESDKPINICCPFIPLIKQIDDGFLYVDFGDNEPEMMPFATNQPVYLRARNNGHFNHYSKFWVVHQSWARDESELWFKINNWGHSSEELQLVKFRESYFRLWKALNKYNCHFLSNFHPAKPSTWPSLKWGEGATINMFMDSIKPPKSNYLSDYRLFIKNSRNISRIKQMKRRFSVKQSTSE